MKWLTKKFEALSPQEIYKIWHIRELVFIVEQNCVYLDCDGKDLSAKHLMGFDGSRLVAYLRVTPPGSRFPEYSLGRILTHPDVRGTGIGKELMRRGIEYIKKNYGEQPIRISAQAHLKRFYSSFGFQQVSEEYLEDEIPHIEMLLDNSV